MEMGLSPAAVIGAIEWKTTSAAKRNRSLVAFVAFYEGKQAFPAFGPG